VLDQRATAWFLHMAKHPDQVWITIGPPPDEGHS
jgi:hypothetical protein